MTNSDTRPTRREIAERIVKEYLDDRINDFQLAGRIEAALKERDERAAEITADILPIGADDCYWCERVQKAVERIKDEH